MRKGGTWTDVIRVWHDVHNESKTSCVHMSHEYDIRPSPTLTHDEILFSHMPFTVHKTTKISQSYKHLTKHTQRRCKTRAAGPARQRKATSKIVPDKTWISTKFPQKTCNFFQQFKWY